MVAMNSIPQQEVANGRGQREFFRANPTTLSNEVAKNPSPMCPSGISIWLIPRSAESLTFKLNRTGRAIIIFYINNNLKPIGFMIEYLIFPMKCSFFDDINETCKEKPYKHQHCFKTIPAQCLKVDGIRIEEDDFNIK